MNTQAHNHEIAVNPELAYLYQAEQDYRRMIATNPSAEAYNNLAVILQELGRLSEAEQTYQLAISLSPYHVEIYCNLGVTLQKQGRFQEAEQLYHRVIAINPHYAEAYNNLAVVLQTLGRLSEAETNYRHAIAVNPHYAEAYHNLAIVLNKLAQWQEAEKNHNRAISINPNYAEAYNELGIMLKELGRFDEAEQNYQKALSLRPDAADIHASFALLLLLLGRLPQGFAEYQWIYHPNNTNPSKPKIPNLSAKQWQGETLQGKTILIYSEQGFGDMIQFVRYAEYLKAIGATTWVLAAKPLFELFHTLPWIDRILQENELHQTAYDFWVFPSALPFWFQTTLETIPVPVPYLSVNSQKSAWWQHWLNQQTPKTNKRVGLVWAGNPNHQNDLNRSIPFVDLMTILNVPNITFISLQLDGKARNEMLNHASALNLMDASLYIQNFMDSAALLSQLDLLITVDSAPAHLAGALDLPVWVLITKLPDWRWLLNRQDSAWYDSVRLFRQSESGDWASVLSEVKSELSHGNF